MSEIMNEINEGTTERKRKSSSAETSVDWFGNEDYCTVYSTHIKFKNWIREMKAEHPEEVEIIFEDDGGIMAKMPKGCLKLSWPRKVNMSEEDRKIAGERLKKAREKKLRSRTKI